MVFIFASLLVIGKKKGDYRASWQPQKMSDIALAKAQHIASKVVGEFGRLWVIWCGTIYPR